MPKLDDYVLPIGKARIARAGKDVTIVAWSMGMTYALKAAEELAKEDIRPRSSTCARSRPMDTDTVIESVKKTGRAGHGRGGLAAVRRRRRDRRAHHGAGLRLSRRAGRRASSGKDVPMPYAANLEKLALPSVAEVVEAAEGRHATG